MNKIAMLLVASMMAGTLSFAGQAGKKVLPDRPNANARAALKRPGAPGAPMLGIIQGLYLSRLRQQTEIGDDQYSRISELLKEFLRERSEIGGTRRLRAENQLAQAVRRSAPDEELAGLIQEFDHIDSEVAAAREKFFANADSTLTVRQRARLRVFMVNMERQINQYIKLSQSPENPPPTPPRP